MLKKQGVIIISPDGHKFEIDGQNVVELESSYNVYSDGRKIGFSKKNLRGKGQKWEGWRLLLGEIKEPRVSTELNLDPVIKVEQSHLWYHYRELAVKFQQVYRDYTRLENEYFSSKDGVVSDEFRQVVREFNELFDLYKEAHNAFYSRS